MRRTKKSKKPAPHGSQIDFARIAGFAALSAGLLSIASCGGDKTDRAAAGGLIGAGAGAVVGSTVGAPVAGAAVGAGVGAATGALTDKEDLDLGQPVWK